MKRALLTLLVVIGIGTWVSRAPAQGYAASTLPVLTATTGAIAPGILIAGACGSGTIAVTGSTTSMAVIPSANTYPGDGVYYFAYVSTNGTVTVKVCAIVGITPNSSTYNVRVVQ